jgi:hypothetical protein
MSLVAIMKMASEPKRPTIIVRGIADLPAAAKEAARYASNVVIAPAKARRAYARATGAQESAAGAAARDVAAIGKAAFDAFISFTNDMESSAKRAEFAAAYDALIQRGADPHSALMLASVAQANLINYKDSSKYIGFFNRYIPFLNAAFQAIKSDYDSITSLRDGVEWWKRPRNYENLAILATGALIPVLYVKLTTDPIEVGDEEYERMSEQERATIKSVNEERAAERREYLDRPWYVKDLYFTFSTPYGLLLFKKPLGAANTVMSYFGRLFDRTILGDQRAFDDWQAPLLNYSPIPFDANLLSVTPADELLVGAGLSDYDAFRDRQIIPALEKELSPAERPGRLQASTTAAAVSDLLASIGAEYDPRRFDYVIRSIGSQYGDMVLRTGDWVLDAAGYSPTAGGMDRLSQPRIRPSDGPAWFSLLEIGGLARDEVASGKAMTELGLLVGQVRAGDLIKDPRNGGAYGALYDGLARPGYRGLQSMAAQFYATPDPDQRRMIRRQIAVISDAVAESLRLGLDAIRENEKSSPILRELGVIERDIESFATQVAGELPESDQSYSEKLAAELEEAERILARVRSLKRQAQPPKPGSSDIAPPE